MIETNEPVTIVDHSTQNDPQTWRQRLKAELHRRELTYPKFAQMMGCSKSQVAKLLQGKARIYQPFVLKAAETLDVSYQWLLGGIPAGDVHCPVLENWQLDDWLSGSDVKVTEGMTCPALLLPGLRTFVWIQSTDELDDGAGGWREGDCLYIDPDRTVNAEKSPVVFAQLHKGWIVRKLRLIAGEEWLVPGNRIYNSIPVDEGVKKIVGLVIGGLRYGDYQL